MWRKRSVIGGKRRATNRRFRDHLSTAPELMTHLREEGIGDIAEVEQACMEPDGMISVIRKGGGGAVAP